MRVFLAAWASMAIATASAQNNWADAGMPFQSVGIRQLYTDSTEDRLIACGQLTVTNDFGTVPLAIYSGGTWDTLGSFNSWVYSVIRFGDTLLVGGGFDQVNGVDARLVAAWYNSAWHGFGDFETGNGVVRKLQVVDGTLYAVGAFLTVDGDTCHGVAKRVGGHWESLGQIEYHPGVEPIISQICEYQGNIVVGGEINPVGLGSDLIQFDGTNWVNVGGGLQGGVGAVTALAVYQGELYAGGGLYVGAGSPGHGIAKWDGSTWTNVGGGMRDIYGTTNYNASASSFLVHDDKLLVGGAFGYAGTVHANQFAVWDGGRWCATGDSVGYKVESMAYYHDTLFITCGNMLNGEPANYIARWVGGAFEQNCEQVGMEEPATTLSGGITIGPDEGGQRALFGLPDGRYTVALFDATGRIVATATVTSTGGHARMDARTAASGLYLVRVTSGEYLGTARFINAQ